MIQIYADWLVKLMDDLRGLELRARRWSEQGIPPDAPEDAVGKLLSDLFVNIAYLQLRSAHKQMVRLQQRVKAGNCTTPEFADLVKELRIRIVEDLGDRVFYCVNDSAKIELFFKIESHDETNVPIRLSPKHPHEFFDPRIINRFEDCIDDLEQVGKCYVASCYTASVFHLMRVVEAGVMEVAKLAEIADPKPSWGSVLSKVDQYAFRTEYPKLPPTIQPHHGLLRDLSNEMHAIQYAWRNKVSHVENKLIPVKPIDQPVAFEIMTAVQAFMRSLGERLPPKQ